MTPTLLMPYEVDRMLRYPKGRSQRLAKRGLLSHIKLPDGEIRFDPDTIKQVLTPTPATVEEGVASATR